MNFARQGIYIGSDLQSLQNLQQEIRTRAADLLQIRMQMTTMQTRKSELETLASAESARIERLTRADLSIPPWGTTLYKPVAATGREVVAGDTLAEALDCRNAFVVAIFSERQAQALSVGSRVKVSSDAWAENPMGWWSAWCHVLPNVSTSIMPCPFHQQSGESSTPIFAWTAGHRKN